MYDMMIRGLMGTRIESIDLSFASVISNNLFTIDENIQTAQDLVALNIARGLA